MIQSHLAGSIIQYIWTLHNVYGNKYHFNRIITFAHSNFLNKILPFTGSTLLIHQKFINTNIELMLFPLFINNFQKNAPTWLLNSHLKTLISCLNTWLFQHDYYKAYCTCFKFLPILNNILKSGYRHGLQPFCERILDAYHTKLWVQHWCPPI